MLHDYCLGKLGKIWAKILCTPKRLLAPTPMPLFVFVCSVST